MNAADEPAQMQRMTAPALSVSVPPDAANRKNMLLLVQLRWIAVTGQVVTIAAVELGLGVPLPLWPMAMVIAGLVALNLVTLAWLRRRAEVSNRELLAALMLDVAALTAQLYLSGGATNPFISLYLLQVTLAAVLLSARATWAVVLFACAGFAGLMLFHRPIQLRGGVGELFELHVIGMLVCFVLDAGLLVFFVTRITRNLRERDARLAALRQRAAEEDHIVRMGLLASGAAHELGTPLSSLAVILNDWRRMPALSADAGMAQEIEEMQTAVQRCKSIVTGVLLATGEPRGEAPRVTSVNAFLDGVADDWRSGRPGKAFSYDNLFGADLAIVSDSTLKQVIFNVLDNAFEAAAGWIGLTAERAEDRLLVRVSDDGPGFTPDMLARLGKPYQSSKGRLGGGLGLFLVVNVVRKLGGMVSAGNRPEGGATVTVELPLAVLTIGTPAHA